MQPTSPWPRAPAPPPAPRVLPPAMRAQIERGSPGAFVSTILIVAGIVLLVVVVGIPLLIVGVSMRNKARAEGTRKLRLLERGAVICGQITDVVHLPVVRRPNERPNPMAQSLDWRIDYRFPINGREVHGSERRVGLSPGSVEPGLLVWVVYSPENPEENVLWPIT